MKSVFDVSFCSMSVFPFGLSFIMRNAMMTPRSDDTSPAASTLYVYLSGGDYAQDSDLIVQDEFLVASRIEIRYDDLSRHSRKS